MKINLKEKVLMINYKPLLRKIMEVSNNLNDFFYLILFLKFIIAKT